MSLRRSRAKSALVALVIGVGASCSSQPALQQPAQKPAAPVDSMGPAFVSPARWDYHPPAPSSAITTVNLGEEGCLFTAEGGQRWWTSPPKAAKEDKPATPSKATAKAKGTAKRSGALCTGPAESSSFVAPEDLVGAVRRADGSWVFVGETGVLYEAKEPLGAFTRTVGAPEPFARISGSGAVLLGATWEGRVLRWEEATGWRPLAKPPGAGATALAPNAPPPARVFDVLVGDGGRALALAFPEALFTSDDGGATWAPAGAPTVGARHLGRTAEGDLAAQGIFETVTWRPGQTPAFPRTRAAIPSAAGNVDPEVGRAPSAPAVFAGRAVLEGDRFYEVLRPEGDGDAWRLARGRIEGRLEILPVPDSIGCPNLKIGARGRDLVAVCIKPAGADLLAVVRRSADAGSTWGEPLELMTADANHPNVAVSIDGAALITGVCRASAPRRDCKPNAPLLVRAEAGALKATIVGAPQLTGLALLPAFSVDGRSAYFLGRRGKDDKINLFASHDGGETFAPRTIDPAAAGIKLPPRPHRDDEEEEESSSPPEVPDAFEVDDSSTLRPGEDGTIGIHLRGRNGMAYVTTDEDGRVVGLATPPGDDAALGGFGRRLVAITLGSDTGLVSVSESLDGGATWDTQRGPASLAREYTRNGTPAIVCSIAGCLLGETVSRVGWGSGGEAAAPEAPGEPAPTPTPTVLTPIVCELSPKTKWTRIDNVHNTQSYGISLPELSSAMRRRSVWSTLTVDRTTGQVTSVSANLPESGDGEARVITQTLLSAHPPTQHLATSISRQSEGWSVARVPFTIERGQVKPGSSMKGVEVVWENYMTSTTGRGRIADAGPFERSDVSVGGFETLDTGSLSVSTSGIVVRPHSRRAYANRMAFFLDPAGRSERFDLPDWPSRWLGGPIELHGDTAAIDGRVIGVGLIHARNGSTNTVVLARATSPLGKPGTTWDFSALGLSPARNEVSPLSFETDWTYVGKNGLGMTSLVADPRRARAWAHYQGFRGDGTFSPPVPLGTPFDLGDRPRPCSAAERAASPRFEAALMSGGAAMFPGTRHPVLVTEAPTKPGAAALDPIVLLTGGAVIHGPPASPCLAAFEAHALALRSHTAILQADLTHAWLFRASYGTNLPTPPRRGDPPVNNGLEYRQMTCRYDPGARVPETVWSEPGTHRN